MMIDDAPETVADLTARAITPAACEMLDGWTLRAIEDFVHAGFPRDSAAVLLIEIEGLAEAVETQAAQVIEICNLHHAREVRLARDAHERDLLWKGRKNAFGAVGRLSPSYYVQDGVIPRTKLPVTLGASRKSARSTAFRSAIFSTPATATFTPSFSSTSATKPNSNVLWPPRAKSCAICVEIGRRAHRRARRRHGKKRTDAADVFRSRSRPDAPHASRVQSGRAAQPRQSSFRSAKAAAKSA